MGNQVVQGLIRLQDILLLSIFQIASRNFPLKDWHFMNIFFSGVMRCNKQFWSSCNCRGRKVTWIQKQKPKKKKHYCSKSCCSVLRPLWNNNYCIYACPTNTGPRFVPPSVVVRAQPCSEATSEKKKKLLHYHLFGVKESTLKPLEYDEFNKMSTK